MTKVGYGVLLNHRQLFCTTTRKLFPHDYPADWAYCPKTGKPLWSEDHTTPIDDYNVAKSTVGGLAVSVVSAPVETQCIIWGDYAILDTRHFCKLPGQATSDYCRRRLYNVLDPLGLWDEHRFGLYLLPGD